MNTIFEALKVIILAAGVIKTLSYGIWCIKNKNMPGGVLLFLLSFAAAALFVFNEARLYI